MSPRVLLASLLFSIISALILTQQTYAQCNQRLSELPDAPELLGFRMGMTREEVKAKVPQVAFGRKDDFGVSKTTINPYFDT